MGDLKRGRSFWSLWLRATCSSKYGDRLTWNHLQQRMSFFFPISGFLPLYCNTRLKNNNTSLPRQKFPLKTLIPPSNLLSHD